MRKDLPKLQDMDRKLKSSDGSSVAASGAVDRSTTNQLPDLLSDDMRRELQRQKWEKEEMEMLDNQDTVYYSNVQYDG